MSDPPPSLHIRLNANICVNFLSVNLLKCSLLNPWGSLKELFFAVMSAETKGRNLSLYQVRASGRSRGDAQPLREDAGNKTHPDEL